LRTIRLPQSLQVGASSWLMNAPALVVVGIAVTGLRAVAAIGVALHHSIAQVSLQQI